MFLFLLYASFVEIIGDAYIFPLFSLMSTLIFLPVELGFFGYIPLFGLLAFESSEVGARLIWIVSIFYGVWAEVLLDNGNPLDLGYDYANGFCRLVELPG